MAYSHWACFDPSLQARGVDPVRILKGHQRAHAEWNFTTLPDEERPSLFYRRRHGGEVKRGIASVVWQREHPDEERGVLS